MSEPLLSDATMATLEAIAGRAMQSVVLVRRTTLSSDGRGGRTQVTVTAATTTGMVYPLGTSPTERVLADRLAGKAGYIVEVPLGTSVLSGDVLQADGIAYQVSAVLDETWRASLRVVCVKD